MDLGVGVVDRWVACALSGVGPWALEKTLVGGAYRNAQWARSIYRAPDRYTGITGRC